MAASHKVATGDEVKGGEMDEEKGRASVDRPSARTDSPRGRDGALTAARNTASSQDDDSKGVKTRRMSVMTQNPQTASPVVDEKTGDAENPNAERPGPTRSADSPHEPPVKPALEVPVERRVSKASREVEDGPDDGDDEERRPGVPTPDEPYGKARDPEGVQVEPGGETGEVERNRCATHESADAEVAGEVAGTHRDVQVEVDSARTRGNASIEGERASATARARSTTAVEENGQRTTGIPDDDNVPGAPPEPLPPVPTHLSDPRDDLKNPRTSSSRGREKCQQASTSDLPAPKRMRWDHLRTTRTLGGGRRSCVKCQNASANVSSREVEKTHQRELQSS